MAAFDPDWNAAVPYTLLIRPDGTVAYKMQSANVDPLQLKRLIIANLSDDDYIGHQAYWRREARSQARDAIARHGEGIDRVELGSEGLPAGSLTWPEERPNNHG